MSELKEYFKSSRLFGVLVIIYLFVGGFHSGPDMILGIISGICLVAYCWKYGAWRQQGLGKACKEPENLAFLLIFIMYMISIAWAVDSGMAVFGLVKLSSLLPFIIFSIFVMPQKNFLEVVPYVGALGVIISLLCGMTALKDYFFLANRMAGAMGYPNAYGLFLLIGIMQLLLYSQRDILNSITFLLLVVGIFWTGSRITFLLFVGFMLIYVVGYVFLKRKLKLVVLGVGSIGVLVGFGFLLPVTRGVLERLFDISLQSSTLLGRLLYMQDALKLLVKFPWGMGYRGYSYTQGLTASGLYSVQFVHNGFLQLILDLGIVMGLAILGIVGYGVAKKVRGKRLLMLVIIGAHVFLDIDTEFMAIVLCIFWLLQGEEHECEEVPIQVDGDMKYRYFIERIAVLAGMMLFLFLGIVPGISNLYYLKQNYQKAYEIYSHNSDARKEIIYASENPYEVEEMIRSLYADNSYSAVACQWMGVLSYLESDYDEVLFYFDRELELLPYDAEEYEMYLAILREMIAEVKGLPLTDEERSWLVEQFDEKREKVEDRYYEKLDTMSELGKAIVDQPQKLIN